MPAPPPLSEPAMTRMRGTLIVIASEAKQSSVALASLWIAASLRASQGRRTCSTRALADLGGRILIEPLHRAGRPPFQFAAAIGAGEVEAPVGAVGAEGAFEGADPGLVRVRRQLAAAGMAVGAHVEDHAVSTA